MNVVDLGSQESLETYRSAIISDLPEILGAVGLLEQSEMLENGNPAQFLSWYKECVAIEGHGATENTVGLTSQQTAAFNPYAIKHRIMGPVELWVPKDDIPEGSVVGDIKKYDQFPEIDKLIPEAYKARRSFVVGALFRGMVGRIEAAVELASRNEALKSGLEYEFVVLTGQREAEAGDLGDGIYMQYFEGMTGLKENDLLALNDEPTMAEAIFRKHLDLKEDPDVVYDYSNQSLDASHPVLGPRKWIKKSFKGLLNGKPVVLTLMNSKAVPPRQGQMNRSGWKPNATDPLAEWIESTDSDKLSQIAVYNVSYAHMLRITAALYKKSKLTDSRMGSAIPVGNMPLQSTWYGVNKNGYMTGGTLGFKELIPVIKNINDLLGIERENISL